MSALARVLMNEVTMAKLKAASNPGEVKALLN